MSIWCIKFLSNKAIHSLLNPHFVYRLKTPKLHGAVMGKPKWIYLYLVPCVANFPIYLKLACENWMVYSNNKHKNNLSLHFGLPYPASWIGIIPVMVLFVHKWNYQMCNVNVDNEVIWYILLIVSLLTLQVVRSFFHGLIQTY